MEIEKYVNIFQALDKVHFASVGRFQFNLNLLRSKEMSKKTLLYFISWENYKLFQLMLEFKFQIELKNEMIWLKELAKLDPHLISGQNYFLE